MGLLRHDRLVVGYDLGEKYSQVSYNITEDYTVETLSSVAGEELYNIPTVLCKRPGMNQWFYGREALRCAGEEDGILVDNILQLALDGEPVLIDGTEFDPAALLALFIKRSLGMLASVSSPDKMNAMMLTCERTDTRMIEVLNRTVACMKLKPDRVFFQSHVESFYNYMLHQPEELWKRQSLLLEYRDNRITACRLENNLRTSPVVAYTECRDFAMTPYEPMPEEESLRREKNRRLDRNFCEVAEKVCSSGIVSSVYLVGENYSEDWMKESLKFLCRGRRVFQGSNLYSKGACLAMLERIRTSEEGKRHVFLGNDKIKSNVGMRILRRGEESYLALLDAGVNWFEAENETEFYVQDCTALEIIVTSLLGRQSRTERFPLEGLPDGAGRLRARLSMNGENILNMEVEDLGFGTLRPATGMVWQREIEL